MIARVDTDVIVVGAGLAGLVAAAELADAGRRVILLDQEPEQSLGGQAFWSLGGLFLVDSPEQRRMGIKDSPRAGAARTGWAAPSSTATRTTGRASGPRPTSTSRPARSAPGCASMGHRLFPVVGWAERGDGRADGHGNSVPRFHLTWGTGPGVVEPFERRVREHVASRPDRAPRSATGSTSWSSTGGAVTGVRGAVLEPSAVERGRAELAGRGRRLRAPRAGRDRHLRRHRRQPRPGPQGLAGAARRAAEARWSRACPPTSTGGCSAITEAAGGRIINPDRMWHYVEGMRNWDPIWANHGIRILPGPSSLWLDATGKRLPAPYFPGFDTLGTLRAPAHDGLRLLVVRADPEDHREGVRAVGLRAEPRPDRQGRQAAAVAGAARCARAGRGVQAARRGLRRRRHADRAGRRA